MNAFVIHAGTVLARAVPISARSTSASCASRRFLASTSLHRRSAFLGAFTAVRAAVPSRGIAEGPTMRVAKDGESVEVHYTGTLEDGTEFDSSRSRGMPLNFVLGSGSVVPGFEKAVRGMAIDERKKAVLVPEEAYGLRTDELVITIPRDRAPSDMKLEAGQKVPLTNGAVATVVEASDSEIKLDANHELAGKTLTFELQLVGILDSVLAPPKAGLERFVCAAGCFWGVELAFQRVPGVVSTVVGYTQGRKRDPQYREVCSGQTGHTEALAVDYDPAVVSYSDLLALFWERLGSSALTLNQVGNDVGTQYRSGIYFLNAEQEALAKASAEQRSKELNKEVVVEVKAAQGKPFYVAEQYHQQYLEKGGQSAAKGDSTPIRCYG